jgi:hypothetical protein
MTELVVVMKDELMHLLGMLHLDGRRLNVWNRLRCNNLCADTCCDGCNEPITTLGDSLDYPGRLRVVAEDVSNFRDASDEYVIADEGVVPYSFQQAVL